MAQELIAKLEAGVAHTADDGTRITVWLAGPVGERVVNVATGLSAEDIAYQAPATRATVLAACQVASELLTIHAF